MFSLNKSFQSAKMLQHFKTIKIIKINFLFWFSVGKCLGLFPFSYDIKEKKFVLSKISRVHSFLIAAIVVIGYPIAQSRFYTVITVVKQGTGTPTEHVAIFGDVIAYSFTVYVYFVHIFKIQKLLQLINNASKFIEGFSKIFPDLDKGRNDSGWLFLFSVFLKIAKISQFTAALFFIANTEKLTILWIFW